MNNQEELPVESGRDLFIEVRDPVRASDSSIDCEVNHRDLGWIPFTASLHDDREYGRELYQRLLNGDYGEVQEGVEVVNVPQSITRAQGKYTLISEGLWSNVLSYIDMIEDPTQKALAEVALNDTTVWYRDSPFLTLLASGLGLDDGRLDELFVAASTVVI